MLAHQNQEMVMAMNFGEDMTRPNSGIGHPGMDAPFGTYPTKDGWVTIAMSPYAKLVGVLGNDDLLEFDDLQTLFDKRDDVWRALAQETGRFTTADLVEKLLDADIWCGEVKTHLEVAADPQVEHLGLLTSYQHPKAGEVRVVGPAVKLSKTPATVERHAPLVGEQTREILFGLGISSDEIDALVKANVVGAT